MHITKKHPVLMSDGTFKTADDIQVGDKVMGIMGKNLKPLTVSKIIQGEQGNGNPSIIIRTKK